MDSHESLVAKAVARALVAAVTACSLVVLLDAGAKYPGFARSAADSAREPSGLERDVAALRGAANTAHRGERAAAAVPPPAIFRAFREAWSMGVPGEHQSTTLASADGDEALDSSGSGAATVKAVGDFPGPELISLPGDWLYHRAWRF